MNDAMRSKCSTADSSSDHCTVFDQLQSSIRAQFLIPLVVTKDNFLIKIGGSGYKSF
jgi:hypothetical protein